MATPACALLLGQRLIGEKQWVQVMGGPLDRREVVARLLAGRKDLLVVTGLGSASYDVMAVGDHDSNYYLWAAMGSAAMVGLGLATAQPGKSVVVVTGDGEMLMGFGVARDHRAAAAGQSVDRRARQRAFRRDRHAGQPRRTRHRPRSGRRDLRLLLDGRDPRHGRRRAICRTRLGARDGTKLATVKIKPENLPRVLPPRDGVYVKNRFRAALGHAPI